MSSQSPGRPGVTVRLHLYVLKRVDMLFRNLHHSATKSSSREVFSMNRVSHRLYVPLLLCALASAATVHAGILFEDGFESGRKSGAQNGFSWSDNTNGISVSNAVALTGSYALRFPFEAVPMGEDSFQEQRVRFGRAYNEMWVSYDLYVPSNYQHRSDSPSNNKFFAIFNNNYNPGWQLNFSLSPDGSQGSRVGIYYYGNGSNQDIIDGPTLIASSDRGKWMHIVMHFKVPSTISARDGVAELWKNGTTIISNKTLNSGGTSTALNNMDEAYILGWANSGFTQETVMYVDNVVFSDTALPLSGGTQIRPSPATVNSVQ